MLLIMVMMILLGGTSPDDFSLISVQTIGFPPSRLVVGGTVHSRILAINASVGLFQGSPGELSCDLSRGRCRWCFSQ